ncbi:DNA double-strand break repair nuclease NurA [Thermoflexus sp.]|uniref:DNA double-strand break repair nuclease NurA n=1 Tax=Thermoflexus sp. TaxID=1969742 RepID=UPI0025F9F610|nr:DNA double-strand break repair nuclease NurA [Thermoflexus sp.]MDW8064180.1 DNA double-strand break repair nuclease NurA [Anaerolineae bacterium]MCS6964684.1 DNA double-strand break repair nuclease NurA [Thermoflexus sp.]MCS7352287.1 DNA double-strand break repair nuclease NurA [Thermoflexus sp.]MCX7691213.1 DNA double-strand break repair nuclease NurA [Thermoflexus sp.]MDW8181750.1 DNA double-strand break repair nuclease NurA [Anaerolineae bacterium]
MRDELERPFAELPAALVEELLGKSAELSRRLREGLDALRSARRAYRTQLEESHLLQREGALLDVPVPTTCGVDGAYAVERLIATDLVAAVAVAVEGLTPPSETRHWPEPRHRAYVQTERHEEEISTLARAVMIGMELELAAQAPHEVVFIDGSLTTPLIYFNQAMNRAQAAPDLHLTEFLLRNMEVYLAAYRDVLLSQRTDRAWVGVPKYSVRREIGRRLGWPASMDDRAMLTNLLEPGEFIRPQPLEAPRQPWHLQLDPLPEGIRKRAEALRGEIIGLLGRVHVIYYRPRAWLPAFRVEMGGAVAENAAQLARVMQALRFQSSGPGILEPYPIYLADRMVKHLGRAIPTFRQVISQELVKTYEGDVDEVFLNLHGYRTESGH